MTPLTFRFPLPDNLAGMAMSHWSVKHKAKRDYWLYLDNLVDEGVLPKKPPTPFPKARIRSVMELAQPMDTGNAMHRHKWIEDWLKTRGYITDDREECLQWEGFPEQIVERHRSTRLVIVTLTPEPRA